MRKILYTWGWISRPLSYKKMYYLLKEDKDILLDVINKLEAEVKSLKDGIAASKQAVKKAPAKSKRATGPTKQK